MEVQVIKQGEEGDSFWAMFFPNSPKPAANELYGNVAEWSNLLVDVS